MSLNPDPARIAPPRGRDLRIDVARGIAMFTMLLSHTRDQELTRWLPNRWSFADAADVFVTLSGLVAGIVFTRIAVTQGWPASTARILRRCRTIWLAQIGSVVGIALLALFIDRVLAGPLGLGHEYLTLWPVSPVLDKPVEALLSLGAMIWVPNNFDILPMYLVLLLFVPVMIGLHRLAGLPAVLLLILASYGLAHAGLNLPANPWNPGQLWYFNPFAWILPFGIAFCFGAGWIPFPRVTGFRAALAALFLVASLPLRLLGVPQRALGAGLEGRARHDPDRIAAADLEVRSRRVARARGLRDPDDRGLGRRAGRQPAPGGWVARQ